MSAAVGILLSLEAFSDPVCTSIRENLRFENVVMLDEFVVMMTKFSSLVARREEYWQVQMIKKDRYWVGLLESFVAKRSETGR